MSKVLKKITCRPLLHHQRNKQSPETFRFYPQHCAEAPTFASTTTKSTRDTADTKSARSELKTLSEANGLVES